MVGEAGIRDFPGIGPGMPLAGPVRVVAKRAAPDDVMSISYTGNDPLVLTHARALLTDPPGTTGHIDDDLNDLGTLRLLPPQHRLVGQVSAGHVHGRKFLATTAA